MANALSAQAAAWAAKHQDGTVLRHSTKDGQIQPLIAAKWIANSPRVMVDQYVPALTSMRAAHSATAPRADKDWSDEAQQAKPERGVRMRRQGSASPN
jgi:hypothetical protein